MTTFSRVFSSSDIDLLNCLPGILTGSSILLSSSAPVLAPPAVCAGEEEESEIEKPVKIPCDLLDQVKEVRLILSVCCLYFSLGAALAQGNQGLGDPQLDHQHYWNGFATRKDCLRSAPRQQSFQEC